MGLLITWGKCGFFLISSMVLGLPDQVQIFSFWYLIEMLGFLTGLGLLKLWHLIYPRLLTGFGMLVYFTNLGLGEFRVRSLALFLLFSVVDGFEWFWIDSLHRSFLLVLDFLKGPFLVLHFSCCILMTFLMVLSLVLASMLMILLSILGVIRHLISGSSLSWLLNINLIFRALWTWLGSD